MMIVILLALVAITQQVGNYYPLKANYWGSCNISAIQTSIRCSTPITPSSTAILPTCPSQCPSPRQSPTSSISPQCWLPTNWAPKTACTLKLPSQFPPVPQPASPSKYSPHRSSTTSDCSSFITPSWRKIFSRSMSTVASRLYRNNESP